MPNTLVHFATQGALVRGLFSRIDLRFIYLGCLLPDLPWILRRVIVGFGVSVDPFDLRLYTMAQASLAGTLLLAAALAVVTSAPRVVFLLLGANAALHLLLDAMEVKWGNGVHLLAPFSWRMTSFDLVVGDGALVLALSLAGGLLVASELLRRPPPSTPFDFRPRALGLAATFLVAYFVTPLAFLSAIQASDSYSVDTLRDVSSREGKVVLLDRTYFVRDASTPIVEVWSGERLAVTGALPAREGSVSLEGRFVSPSLLQIDRIAEHRPGRDWASYVALLLLTLVWLRPLITASLHLGGRGVA